MLLALQLNNLLSESGGADTTPDAFTFTDVTGVPIVTTIESNTITVAGIDSAAAISITGGEYRINGGSWTSSSGTVNNADTVQVRHTSAATYEATINTALTIGGVSDTFSSETEAEPAGGGNAVSWLRRRRRK